MGPVPFSGGCCRAELCRVKVFRHASSDFALVGFHLIGGLSAALNPELPKFFWLGFWGAALNPNFVWFGFWVKSGF